MSTNLIKIILGLHISYYDELTEFLKDGVLIVRTRHFVDEYLKNNRKKIKIINYYKHFLEKYSDLLDVFIKNNVFEELIDQISFEESYQSFMYFVKYTSRNIRTRDKLIEQIIKLENLGLFTIHFLDFLDYTVTCKEMIDGQYHSLDGIYSDGKLSSHLSFKTGLTNYYSVAVHDANYVISYCKDNVDGLKDIVVHVKNLEFEPDTLPSYIKLYGKNNWQNLNIPSGKTYSK